MSDNKKYAIHYNEESFFNKIKKYAKKLGETLIEQAFILYYTLQAPGTPAWAKTTIIGALGYLILPIDLIPDIIPVIGFSDDAGVLVAAIATVQAYVTPEIKEMAKDKMTLLLK